MPIRFASQGPTVDRSHRGEFTGNATRAEDDPYLRNYLSRNGFENQNPL